MSLVLCSGFSLEFFHWLWSAIARQIFCLIYCHLSQSNTQYKNTKKITVYHMKIIQIGISQIQHCTSLCDLSVGFALPSTSHFFLDPYRTFFFPSLLPCCLEGESYITVLEIFVEVLLIVFFVLGRQCWKQKSFCSVFVSLYLIYNLI